MLLVSKICVALGKSVILLMVISAFVPEAQPLTLRDNLMVLGVGAVVCFDIYSW